MAQDGPSFPRQGRVEAGVVCLLGVSYLRGVHNPTTPLSLALCLSALTMREIRLVIASLNPGHEGEALLNRIRMQG
jgi:hypothetical protein